MAEDKRAGRRARSVSPMRRLLSKIVPGSPERNAARRATASEGHEPAANKDTLAQALPRDQQDNSSADTLLDSGTSSFYDAEEARSWTKYSSRPVFFSMSESEMSDSIMYNTAFSSLVGSDVPTTPQVQTHLLPLLCLCVGVRVCACVCVSVPSLCVCVCVCVCVSGASVRMLCACVIVHA
jgi:hypothetical protein